MDLSKKNINNILLSNFTHSKVLGVSSKCLKMYLSAEQSQISLVV